MKPYYLFTLLFFTALFACKTNTTENTYGVCLLGNRMVKVYQLDLRERNSIKKMDNYFVEVTGYYYENFEDGAIYSGKHGILGNSNALWVSTITHGDDTLLNSQLRKLNGKKITLIGKLDLSRKGHLGSYTGTLDSVFFAKEN